MRNRSHQAGRRGLWIAFFGPDGAGKSAVIAELAGKLEASFAGVERFHFRPMFRRNGVDGLPVTDPHAQLPRSTLASLGKLIYWLADCWFGYMITIRPAVTNSRLVIFDRYLPDILVDPLRYRLPASCRWFARVLLPLLPRPDLCVLLDAPADVVQERKQEVSLAESQRQRAAYLHMFEALPNTLLVDAALSVDEVAQQIDTAIFVYVTNSSMTSREAFLIAHM
jgi:thymidylate kinase